MPLYSYRCSPCDVFFDAFQTIQNRTHGTCPTCKKRCKLLPSAGSFIVKDGPGRQMKLEREMNKNKEKK